MCGTGWYVKHTEETRKAKRILVSNKKEKFGGRIIVKWILKKQRVVVRNVCITGYSGGLL
jgi:hypothetical protein